ncbi:hypothetical protein [Spirosoma spitsbergense]|uniref:hypothetical protein n=1 Tax=Spirosoma spitsbergense TaxID=431554 RepID=UPI000369FC71|nr:hypothetical protein [Spirosoma spitsbergense]
MNRPTASLLGPELVWLLLLAIAGVVVSANQTLTGAGRGTLVLMKLFLPSVGVMLAFVPLFWAPGSQSWFLGRIVFASLVGVVGLVYFLSRAASYDDSRNVGLILGFVGFVFIGWTVLALMGGVATLFLLSHWSFLPVLTWILVLFALFMIALCIVWRFNIGSGKALGG